MVATTRYLVNGISLAVSSRGPSSRGSAQHHLPVVLLPGTAATAADWDTVAADLSRDRMVHAVDLRGHGDSAWPGEYSIELMARDLVDLLPRLAAEVDVVGHSLGGLVACFSVSVDPGVVRRLVLEDVGVPHPRIPATPARPDGDLGFDWTVVEQIRPEIDTPAPHWRATLSRITTPTLVIGAARRASCRRSTWPSSPHSCGTVAR